MLPADLGCSIWPDATSGRRQFPVKRLDAVESQKVLGADLDPPLWGSATWPAGGTGIGQGAVWTPYSPAYASFIATGLPLLADSFAPSVTSVVLRASA